MVSAGRNWRLIAADADFGRLKHEDIQMENAAIALAILGFAMGVVFRLKTLLPILALLLIASMIFSLTHHFTFLDTALTVMAAQSLVQAGYFLGLVVRAVFTAGQRTRPIF
jgi:ABC-type iron transport system FetAB permease component